MRWLEHPNDKAEALLRDGLDAAERRVGDEVARRRIWAAIEDLPLREEPLPRRSRPWLVPALSGALVAACAALVFWAVPFHRSAGTHPPVANGNTTVEAPRDQAVARPVISAPSTVRTGSGEKARIALEGGADVQLDANSVMAWDAEHRPMVVRGSVTFQVPHQAPGTHFAVAAGPYTVYVVGTKFNVSIENERVGVDVIEGVVEVRHGRESVRLTAGDSWAGPARAVASADSERVSSRQRRASLQAESRHLAPVTSSPASADLAQARAALADGQAEEAAAILARVAQGSGPSAENASYELGRVLREQLHRPRAAVAAWERYRNRFPRGLLRAETDLSIVETLASLGDNSAALAEAESFLAVHPGSERHAEVARLAARLRGNKGP